MPRSSRPVLTAFLSHRYQATEVNSRLFRVFSDVANVQFEVDVGVKATNVTRLERLIRDADAFIGIYPLPDDVGPAPDRSALLASSRYFRLELELAIRSRRPALVFADRRYGNVITAPPSIPIHPFDHQQVLGRGANPMAGSYRAVVKEFCEMVVRGREQEEEWRHGPPSPRTVVGLLLPTARPGRPGYRAAQIRTLEALIGRGSQSVVRLDAPILDGEFYRKVEDLDWLVADIGVVPGYAEVVGLLHGRFVPMMRLLLTDGGDEAPDKAVLETLFGGLEVGYSKDIVRWHDHVSLKAGVLERLATLNVPRKRITTKEEAQEYFAEAAKRKEAVFVSYSGADQEAARPLISALKKRFQQVFDYRDLGKSIPPGSRWLETVFASLSASALGIPLLSESYFSSGNCKHEALQMAALEDAGKLRIVPIKLRKGELSLPDWLQSTQYLKPYEYANPDEAVDTIVRSLG
jgi:hypothetical protein